MSYRYRLVNGEHRVFVQGEDCGIVFSSEEEARCWADEMNRGCP